MNRIKLLMIIFATMQFQSCFIIKRNPVKDLSNHRKDLTYGMSERAKKDWQFYNRLTRYMWDYDVINQLLEDGADPNYCGGECGWDDHNPLMVITDAWHFTYEAPKNNNYCEEKDYATIKLLYKYNADFNKYPYVWKRVFSWSNEEYQENYEDRPLDVIKDKERKSAYIEDSNRVLRALLECGANPNYKGHPYPFSHKAVIQEKMTGEEAIQYFNSAEATTPLYEAIKKGIDWEPQIDLLLKYGATVDKSCIEAAKLSGDKKMMEKIQKLIESKNKWKHYI